ncbi:DgyrCDS11309 [Dimorphilus gyrociliatus]|uniref:Centrosomal protein CCDC61 n=1 Tax=Dimorphilus gyrociliatus TaxID=2664684 RepID=A0A7I8W2V8_9ANNE|nr:DgyrCDS11309 [Dimorphilus gyrociliatus]
MPPSTAECSLDIRGTEYSVGSSIDDDCLHLVVEDVVTNDVWKASFNTNIIEEITRRTGNFKQFSVFCSMLTSAIEGSSDSVDIDIMTYEDLEHLRKRSKGKNGPGPKQSQNKRYLILIYTAEFDRIHYPLQLQHEGKSENKNVHKTISKLREDIITLQKRCKILQTRNSQLEDEISQQVESNPSQQTALMKTALRNLEEQSSQAKAKYQRAAQRRKTEIGRLRTENEELKASERNLKAKVKSLTNELAIYKRRIGGPGSGRSSYRSNNLSGTSSLLSDHSRNRSRSLSNSRNHSLTSDASKNSRVRNVRSRTPSPGLPKPRFDPTAYIKEKERKKRELDIRRKRRNHISSRSPSISPRSVTSNDSRHSRSRYGNLSDSSRNSKLSRTRYSSFDSLDSDTDLDKRRTIRKTSLDRRSNSSKNIKAKPNLDSSQDSIDIPRSRFDRFRQKGAADNFFDERSAEISEIDARLNRLQEFMKDHLELT